MTTSPERIAIPDLEKKLASKSKPFVIDVRKPAEIEESGHMVIVEKDSAK